MAKSDNSQLASLAAIVLDVARVKPHKTRRLKFLAQKHPELLGKLRHTGLILDWPINHSPQRNVPPEPRVYSRSIGFDRNPGASQRLRRCACSVATGERVENDISFPCQKLHKEFRKIALHPRRLRALTLCDGSIHSWYFSFGNPCACA
jgi:hypothetical protein